MVLMSSGSAVAQQRRVGDVGQDGTLEDPASQRGWYHRMRFVLQVLTTASQAVLDQAYRTARDGVYIVFSTNRSREWFG